MSYSNAAPSFGQAPEANGHGTDPVKVDPDRITIAVILARMTEFSTSLSTPLPPRSFFRTFSSPSSTR